MVLDIRRPILVPAPEEDLNDLESGTSYCIESMVCIPLKDALGIMGFLQIDTSRDEIRFNEPDLDFLAHVGTLVSLVMENSQLEEKAREYGYVWHAVQGELERKGKFLPDASPEVEQYDFFHAYEPAKTSGGDLIDYVSLPNKRLAIVMGNAASKGVIKPLLFRATLGCHGPHCLRNEPNPQAAMAAMNEIYCDTRWDDGFAMLVFVVLDPQRHEVCLANAGHIAPILRRADGSVEEIGAEQSGLPLGVTEDTVYEPVTVRLDVGDSLILYSSGIPDTMAADSEFYGYERLLAEITAFPWNRVEAMGRHIMEDVRRFAGSQEQCDDRTLLAFRRNE
jgi:sigma-B regulation protein RsbU (phosphoserine phosphatase)